MNLLSRMDEPESEILRRNIKRFRNELGLSQAEAASMVRVPENTYKSWEQGQREPNSRHIRKLATAFGRDNVEDFYQVTPPARKPDAVVPALALRIIDKNVPIEMLRQIEEMIKKVSAYMHGLAKRRKK